MSLETRSSPRGKSRSRSGKSRGATKAGKPEHAPSPDLDEITERAARLGITKERVLHEYAAIAFADLRHIVEWGPDGIRIRSSGEVSDDDARAISEIVPGNDPAHSRVKLYDKEAALNAIARHLGMFPLPARRPEPEAAKDEEEDPREFLTRELARIAARGDQE